MPTKAFENPEFMLGEDARGIRILCEYQEPLLRFRRLQIRNTVMFLGSARLEPGPDAGGRDYYMEAAALAERVAQWTVATHSKACRYHICTGGGPGIMQAAHEGGSRVDSALNVGLNIALPMEEKPNPFVQDQRALEFHYFFMRKLWFVSLARGAVFFPGGFGTLDELFELLTLRQTGRAELMPILLYGREYWERMVDFQQLAERGLISAGDLDLVQICDDVETAFSLLRSELRFHAED